MFRNLSRLRADSAQPPVDVPRGTSGAIEDEAGRGSGQAEVPVAEVHEKFEYRQTSVDTSKHNQ